MSEKRRKSTTVLLRNQGKIIKLELFPAVAWGGPEGCHRVRLNGRWHCPGGGKYEYFAPAGVAGLVASLLSGEPYYPEARPNLRRGDRVRVPVGNGYYDKTFVAGPPILGLDGRWWVAVAGSDEAVAVDMLLPQHRGNP
ncbi:hypothetical protein K9F62_10040 [Desulfovibrio sp. JY]|nr:hypothetical protein K9F62_10040 [Desulfovibrio sp. JY]